MWQLLHNSFIQESLIALGSKYNGKSVDSLEINHGEGKIRSGGCVPFFVMSAQADGVR